MADHLSPVPSPLLSRPRCYTMAGGSDTGDAADGARHWHMYVRSTSVSMSSFLLLI